MFSRKTLLVVGAGASKEIGMPIGEELAEQIASLFPSGLNDFGEPTGGDREFLGSVARYSARERRNYYAAGNLIRDGIQHFRSIDNFIYAHKHDPDVAHTGKLAIVYSILKAESRSHLAAKGRSAVPDFKKMRDSWYPFFGDILRDGLSKGEIETIFDNLTIICFNYDRCIEEYLVHWLGSAFAISRDAARALVEMKLSILHPYGSISQEAAFGADPQQKDIGKLAKGIKTYTEQIEDAVMLAKIRDAVASAETVAFLGFGYNKQNMELLMPAAKPLIRRLYASAYGFSAADTEDIANSIKILFSRSDVVNTIPIKPRNDLTCVGLFKEYRRTLSA